MPEQGRGGGERRWGNREKGEKTWGAPKLQGRGERQGCRGGGGGDLGGMQQQLQLCFQTGFGAGAGAAAAPGSILPVPHCLVHRSKMRGFLAPLC